jgi:hypothetical protein
LVELPLEPWRADVESLEASGGGQGSELQQPPGKAVTKKGVGNQHDVAAIGLHGLAAPLDIDLFVNQHHRRQVVVPRELSHQPVHSRLGANTRRASWHPRNVKDTETRWAHGIWTWAAPHGAVRLGLSVALQRGTVLAKRHFNLCNKLIGLSIAYF